MISRNFSQQVIDPAARPRLLIVEDHELVAQTLALALGQVGMEVETTAGPSLEAVLDTVARFRPVLVLLDLELGAEIGSGLDLVRPITESGASVVLMTGVTERARLAAAVEAGAKGILSKAGGFEELVGAVRRFLDGEAILADHQRHELLAELRARRSADRERLQPFETLTAREQSVLALLVAGDSAEVIAAKSYVSLATVRSQIQSIFRKLGVNSQVAAVALARGAGWPDG
ncbi:MAG TPA: response regulator transcription factor [Acidimicrobiales bacterium]|nr:response regulator transcription factor [Acidimicrobiales bacterium]